MKNINDKDVKTITYEKRLRNDGDNTSKNISTKKLFDEIRDLPKTELVKKK